MTTENRRNDLIEDRRNLSNIEIEVDTKTMEVLKIFHLSFWINVYPPLGKEILPIILRFHTKEGALQQRTPDCLATFELNLEKPQVE